MMDGNGPSGSRAVKIALSPVDTDRAVDAVAGLAQTIWNEYFPAIIGQDQVNYMVGSFQSRSAIRRQIDREGYRYFLIATAAGNAGYIALVPMEDNRRMQISKFYLMSEWRGRGLARQVLTRTASIAWELGFKVLYLTVNRYNAKAISAYERLGFSRTGELVTDIGGGFVMDDFEMEMPITGED